MSPLTPFFYNNKISVTTLANELLVCADGTSKSTQKSLSIQNMTDTCITLAEQLINQTYETGQYTRFAICDPKLREIYAPEFRDRLVQSWLVKQIEPIVERELIEDTFANRKNKGTLAALDRTQHFMRQPNHRYYLQLDIQNFFNSIHRPTLLNLWLTILQRYQQKTVNQQGHYLHYSLERYKLIANISTLILTQDITLNPYIVTGSRELLLTIPKHKLLASSPPNTGLPIGAVSSQTFANLYLSPLDHFAKHQLKIKGYTRYMDDIFILADSTELLNYWQQEIELFLTTLKIRLHPTKQHLQRCELGADYLGYKIYPHYRHLRARNIKKLFRWLRFFNQLANQQAIKHCPDDQYWREIAINNYPITYNILQKMQSVLNSYFALLAQSNQYQLRRRIYHHYFKRLTHWFLPNNSDYSSVSIKKWVKAEYLNQLRKLNNATKP